MAKGIAAVVVFVAAFAVALADAFVVAIMPLLLFAVVCCCLLLFAVVCCCFLLCFHITRDFCCCLLLLLLAVVCYCCCLLLLLLLLFAVVCYSLFLRGYRDTQGGYPGWTSVCTKR